MPGQLLDAPEVCRLIHHQNLLDFLWVRLDTPGGYEVAEQLPSWYSEDALRRVQLDLIFVECVEGLAEVVEERDSILCFDDYVIHIHLHILPDLFREAGLHVPLVGVPRVLEPEGHS